MQNFYICHSYSESFALIHALSFHGPHSSPHRLPQTILGIAWLIRRCDGLRLLRTVRQLFHTYLPERTRDEILQFHDGLRIRMPSLALCRIVVLTSSTCDFKRSSCKTSRPFFFSRLRSLKLCLTCLPIPVVREIANLSRSFILPPPFKCFAAPRVRLSFVFLVQVLSSFPSLPFPLPCHSFPVLFKHFSFFRGLILPQPMCPSTTICSFRMGGRSPSCHNPRRANNNRLGNQTPSCLSRGLGPGVIGC
jgi:hypothetical protein